MFRGFKKMARFILCPLFDTTTHQYTEEEVCRLPYRLRDLHTQ